MTPKETAPLGYVELANGSKAIYPMNDIFLNFTFEDAEHWESLRLAINLLIVAFKQKKPDAKIKIIEGTIKVRTQFRHLLDTQNTTRDQDIKLTEDETESTYIEFQNRARADIPIEIRSVVYFGLGIGHSKGNLANQIWLLAEDVDSVLHGKTFTRYILKDEITGNEHPAASGIMYVSLTNLSQEESPAGELAGFLLGKVSNPKDEVVTRISKTFNSSFDAFKSDKEAVNVLSLAERYRSQAEYDKAIEIAKKMLMRNTPVEIVVEDTALDGATVNQLREEISSLCPQV